MNFRNGEIVEITGEIYGTIVDPFGYTLYQVCIDNNIVVAVPEKCIKFREIKKVNYIETKEYKPGRFK